MGQIVVSNFMFELTQEQKNEGISFGLDELSRPYDNWEIFRIMLRILLRIGKKERNRDYICSELVRSCYAKSGYLFKMNDSYVSPQEIWQDENIEMKYRVH